MEGKFSALTDVSFYEEDTDNKKETGKMIPHRRETSGVIDSSGGDHFRKH